MVRITKNREERKQELIDIAQYLFLTKGYEQTAVSEIVKEINVAQGTFYYHFKSKVDILEAVVEKFIAELMDELWKIAKKIDVEPVKRLNKIINCLFQFHANTENKELVKYLHNESNIVLHDKLGKIILAKLIPIITFVIKDGISKGCFKVSYPSETAEFLIIAISQMLHEPDIIMTDSDRRERVLTAIEENVSRVLGVTDYSFKLELQ